VPDRLSNVLADIRNAQAFQQLASAIHLGCHTDPTPVLSLCHNDCRMTVPFRYRYDVAGLGVLGTNAPRAKILDHSELDLCRVSRYI